MQASKPELTNRVQDVLDIRWKRIYFTIVMPSYDYFRSDES
jgi:hypothetical protein